MQYLSIPKLISLMVIFPLLTACGLSEDWDSTDTFLRGVWDNEGEHLAAVRTKYERRTNFLGTRVESRNHTYQVYTGSASTIDEISPRYKEEKGSVQKTYYSRDEDLDYVLVASSGDAQPGFLSFDQYFDDGSKRHLRNVRRGTTYLDCDGFRASYSPSASMVPSPDGKLLGFAFLQLQCDGLSLVVEFISPETGMTVDGPNTYELPKDSTELWNSNEDTQKSFSSLMWVAWSEEDELIVAFSGVTFKASAGIYQRNDDTRGYRLAPNATSIPFDSIDRSCLTPQTTSSYMNTSGAWLTSSSGKLVILQATDSLDLFGCGSGYF